jgi:hypothetical protein
MTPGRRQIDRCSGGFRSLATEISAPISKQYGHESPGLISIRLARHPPGPAAAAPPILLPLPAAPGQSDRRLSAMTDRTRHPHDCTRFRSCHPRTDLPVRPPVATSGVLAPHESTPAGKSSNVRMRSYPTCPHPRGRANSPQVVGTTDDFTFPDHATLLPV